MRYRKYLHPESGKLLLLVEKQEGEGDPPFGSLEFNDQAHMDLYVDSAPHDSSPHMVAMRKMRDAKTVEEDVDRDAKTGEVKVIAKVRVTP